MKKLFLLFSSIIFIHASGPGQPRPDYWQQKADYQITVLLNDTAHTLDGETTISYTNHSPDTLQYLWIHLWPNAYKNDKTAFAEQSLLSGDMRFYFSKPEEKGYINRLQFTANGQPLTMEDHPLHIDITKLLLNKPLPPGQTIQIFTPFHVQLPFMFSRGGHDGQFYAATQWFPKIALYDKQGWHPMPYLHAGEYYSDFGDYDVQITLPANYAVAATGTLQDEGEKTWLKSRMAAPTVTPAKPAKKELFRTTPKDKEKIPASDDHLKTIHYTAKQVIDFAWFADKRFIVKYDTVSLPDRTIEAWNFLLPDDEKRWKESMLFTKRSLQFYNQQLGVYPYPQVTVVSDPVAESDGMEYPMITLLNDKGPDAAQLDVLIAHEVGHNWLQAVLATNERDHAWMDEGVNSFYENRYVESFYKKTRGKGLFDNKIPSDISNIYLDYLTSSHKDQPIATSSEQMNPSGYYPIIYQKTAAWLKNIEKQIGPESFDKAMRLYYDGWKFKHPQPENLQQILEQETGQPMTETFDHLRQTGPVAGMPVHRPIRLTGLFSLMETRRQKYISVGPALGYNAYDKLQLGVGIHNYNIPSQPFQFVFTPMYATGSKQLTGYGRIGYTWFPSNRFSHVELYTGMARFATDDYEGLNGEKVYSGFTKVTPGITLEWKKKNPLATSRKWVDFRTFIISEQQVNILNLPPPADTVFYAVRNGSVSTFIPQLTMGWANERTLYPWRVEASLQQVKKMLRTSVTAQYFLQYNASGKGASLRLFAGKIFYTTDKTDKVRNDHNRYHFTMYAPNGQQDYTYSNPFAERNQAVTLAGRQVMIRDGGFKYRSDYSSVQPGLKSTGVDYFDNWMFTLNFGFDIPAKINPLEQLPIKIPLKIFADIGTSASPWTTGSSQEKFLYSIGLHLPILKVLHFYYPIIQSSAFKEPNSVNDPFRAGGPLWWQKRLTYSLDLSKLTPKIAGQRLW